MTLSRNISALALLVSIIALAIILGRSLEASSRSLSQSSTKLVTLRGTVVDSKGPVKDAIVRIQLTDTKTRAAADGSFQFRSIAANKPITLTAWSKDYYIGWTTTTPSVSAVVTITLDAHYQTDNVKYDWFSHEGIKGSAACGECHVSYEEWKQDAHSQSASNYRFQTIYAGSDVHGNRGQLTRWDGKLGIARPPDPNLPYFGAGFMLDNPGRAGNCATCHAPVAAKIPNNQNCTWSGCHLSSTAQKSEFIDDAIMPVNLTGAGAEGISCEFCHKTASIQINSDTKLPYEDSPGILSTRLLRPTGDNDLFFGPFDDVVRPELPEARDAYLPLQQESEFCAGCHYGVMGGVVSNMKVKGGVLVYSSFAEWQASHYNNAQSGKTCQNCHMPPVSYNYFAYPEKGGQHRDSQLINSHKMLGASDELFLQNAVTLSATATIKAGKLQVDVRVSNDQTGHHVPTDSTMRHVMLVVEAKDGNGKPLILATGDQLPAWTGDYAEQPGRVFAKVLRDTWTGESPTVAIWRPVEIVSDTRIAAGATDASHFTFAVSKSGTSTVNVRLIYRRAPQQLMEQKGWSDKDILMESMHLTLSKQ